MRSRLLAAALLCGAACAAPKPIWTPAETTYAPANGRYAVDLPAGWVRFNRPRTADDLVLTRDGMALELLVVGAVEPGKPFPVGSSKRPVTAEMTPQEAAEVAVDGLESGSGWSNVQVLENAPAVLAGRKGFRVVASYKESTGLRTGIALYGLVTPTATYYLLLQAPQRVYFPRHLPAFDRMAASFQLRGANDAKPAPAAATPSS